MEMTPADYQDLKINLRRKKSSLKEAISKLEERVARLDLEEEILKEWWDMRGTNGRSSSAK